MMIFVPKIRAIPIRETELGRLVITDEGVTALLVADPVGDKHLFVLSGDNIGTAYVDNEEMVLELGVPAFRIDPAFTHKSGAPLIAGTLVFSKEGTGVYAKHPSLGRMGMIGRFDGSTSNFYYTNGTPAFTRWEIGVASGQHFETVLAISVSN